MTDLKKTVQDDKGALRSGDDASGEQGDSHTSGTNRDYDDSQESQNQAHGHARQGKERSEKSGRSNKTVSDTDRQQRDLGGPGA